MPNPLVSADVRNAASGAARPAPIGRRSGDAAGPFAEPRSTTTRVRERFARSIDGPGPAAPVAGAVADRVTLSAEPLPGAEPSWEPLLALVGDELAAWFGWAGALRLADGGELHVYTHTVTHRPIRVANDGRAFAVDAGHTAAGTLLAHEQIPRAKAITQALIGWGRSATYEAGKHGPLIDAAVSRAVLGARFWVDAEAIAAQRAAAGQFRPAA